MADQLDQYDVFIIYLSIYLQFDSAQVRVSGGHSQGATYTFNYLAGLLGFLKTCDK